MIVVTDESNIFCYFNVGVTVVLNLAYFESQMSSFMAATSTDISV